MKILLVADQPSDAEAVHASLRDDGHSVTTCNDSHGGPCRGVGDLDACPLDGSIDVAVVARPADAARGLGEMGAVCATRHRIGVIEIDPAAPPVESIYDLADAAEARICEQYAAIIASRLGESLAGQPFDVTVRRRDHDVQATVHLRFAAEPIVVSAVADRARAAVRSHDHFAQVIDVSVVQNAC